MRKLLALLSVLFAAPAVASQISWVDLKGANAPTITAASSSLGDYQSAAPGGIYIYFVNTNGVNSVNDNTEVIDVSACAGGATLMFWPDVLAGTDYTAEGRAYYCPTGSPTTTGCHKLTADINDTAVGVDDYDLTGDPGTLGTDADGSGTDDNRQWMEGIKFPFIFVKFSVDCPDNKTCGFQLYCPSK